MSKYGRYAVPETMETLATWTHVHQGAPLKAVMHEIPLAVLDQEDLIAQGIDTSQVVAGAPKVDALGSCTANAATATLSAIIHAQRFLDVTGCSSMADVKRAEEWAIAFYAACTAQTGKKTQEWPPTDCGSSGPYVVEELVKRGLVSGAEIASGGQNIVSLLQRGPLMLGCPFLNAWEDPGPGGDVDGNGSASYVEQQIRRGVAGGHETVIRGTEKLTLTETGLVDPFNTLLRVRNSWTRAYGDDGEFVIHLSTLLMLGSSADFRLLIPA